MAKQLSSILGSVPPATARKKEDEVNTTINTKQSSHEKEQEVRINVRVPLSLKLEIQDYIKKNSNENERTLVMRGLKKLGFTINDGLLTDKRKNR